MKGSLTRRLMLWIGLPLGALFTLAAWFGASRSFNHVERDTEEYARLMARYQAERIEESMNGWVQIPSNIAYAIESDAFTTEAALEAFLRRVVDHNSDVHGCCIAFEPGAFTPGKHFYAPYWHWKGKEVAFVQVGNPDYDYFKWEWYAEPKRTGRKMWTEPFFDEGGGDVMMTTYCVPFRRDGVFRGVATVDVALEQLIKETKGVPVGREGYILLLSRSGRFLVCPDESKVMKATIHETNPELGRLMTGGKEGLLRAREPFGGRAAWVAFAPIWRESFSLAVVIPEAEAMAGARMLVGELVAIGALGLLGMLVGLWRIARSAAKPIASLAEAARTVAAGQLEVVPSTPGATTEVQELTSAFAKMTGDLRRHMDELRATTAERERVAGELDAARNIQMGLVPQEFPAFPDRPAIDLHGVVLPAREVGGDLCNFFFVDERRLVVIVGDVAGKGVPAALFMAVTSTLLKAYSQPGRSPGEVVTLANRELFAEAASGVFVTVLYALLDTVTGDLEVCNAGHHAPLILSADGRLRPLDRANGPACAILGDFTFTSTRHRLAPGDTIVCYSDGITEAMNAKHELFSHARLERELRRAPIRPAAALTAALLEAVRRHTRGVEQNDDITLLALRWSPVSAPVDSHEPISASGVSALV